LADLKLVSGGQTITVGEQLLENQALGLEDSRFGSGNFSMNFGNQLAAILLSQPLTAAVSSQPLTATGVMSGMGAGFDMSALSCPLVAGQGEAENGSLADLFDAEAVSDPQTARAGVVSGEYAAAVLIPHDFSKRLAPDFGFGGSVITATGSMTTSGLVEVVANNATPISASIVRSVVDRIVSQFERANVAISALALTTIGRLKEIDVDKVDPSLLNVGLIIKTIQHADRSVIAPLGCLFTPGANNITIQQQALDKTQEGSPFSILIVTLGGGQAIFFALFTGVFGINSIYEDRRQGTLQRVLVSPTTSTQVLFGRLLGNLVIVASQLGILLVAFTTIASVVAGQVTFVWGTNVAALLAVILGLSLFTTGMGVLIVGLADSPEQVQLIGPIATLLLGALGGIFGPLASPAVARFSPTWWGIDALHKLAAQQLDIGPNLLVLFGVGGLFAVVGTYFFRRRMEL
jgi:ABC-type multidrug transport system permease subunit